MKVSNRTKNRLKEHSLVFDFFKTNDRVCGFEGRKMVFAECEDCGWFGWLPEEEIK